jgi:hypothetical protein
LSIGGSTFSSRGAPDESALSPACPAPQGFHRIRHHGLLTSGYRKTNVARERELLAIAPAPMPETGASGEPDDQRPPCPCCGGRMIIIEVFERKT